MTTPVELKADPVVPARAELGEGPVWDQDAGRLRWVDINAGLVHAYDPATGTDEVVRYDQSVGCIALRSAGGLVAGVRDGFALLSEDGGLELIAPVEQDRADLRMNDGRCDPAGRFLAGTMSTQDEAGAGSLYCLETDGRVRRVWSDLTVSNGLDWSSDGRRLFFIDSVTRRVDVCEYDVETGAVGDRLPAVAIPPPGYPDGMCIDAEDALWVALWDGGAVHRYSPDGVLLAVVGLPCSRVTSCTFGGPNLSTLYITSAREGLRGQQLADQPLAGALFAVDPDVRGRPANTFDG